MEVLVGAVIGLLIGAVISGFVIWVVGKLNIGLTVEGFGSAMIAGLVIGFGITLVRMVIPESGGLIGAVISLVIAAVVILAAGKILSGLTVKGFGGALAAAVAIAVVYYLLALVAISAT